MLNERSQTHSLYDAIFMKWPEEANPQGEKVD